MAITHIHPVDDSPQKLIDYCDKDRAKKIINSDGSIGLERDENGNIIYYPTYKGFVNMIHRSKPMYYFNLLQDKYNSSHLVSISRTSSGKERVIYHAYQNFGVEYLDPIIANEIGRKLCTEMFGDYACVVDTHTNTDYVHNHIYFSAFSCDGKKKYHDCIENTNRFRTISDKLCTEYGLPILENTKTMKLIKYKDKKDKSHYWEPTARKIDLVKKRERGEISKYDVNSYVNSPSYEVAVGYKETNRNVITHDIDSLLDIVLNYDDLLFRLKELGYEIKSNKNNGDWLKHISFRAPAQEGFSRDNSLGDNNFYTRESLTAEIKSRVAARITARAKEEHNSGSVIDITNILQMQNEYKYGSFDMNMLNPDYRKKLNSDGDFVIENRGEVESTIVRDILKKHSEIDERFHSITYHGYAKRNKSLSPERRAQLVNQIQNNFKALHIAENKKLITLHQIISEVNVMQDKYEQLMNERDKVITIVKQVEYRLTLPEKIKELEEKIASNRGNMEYMLEEYDLDKTLLNSYKNTVKGSKINNPDVRHGLMDFIVSKKAALNKQEEGLNVFKKRLDDYQHCMNTVQKILSETDKENEYVQAMNSYKESISIERKQEQKEQKLEHEYSDDMNYEQRTKNERNDR